MSKYSMSADCNRRVEVDLIWMDMLKGIAIIGVIFDHWTPYMILETTPALLYSLVKNFP